jgi:hypothetical protein
VSRRDTAAGIGYLDAHGGTSLRRCHGDDTPWGRVDERVRDKIADCALKERPVDLGLDTLFGLDRECNPGLGSRSFVKVLHQRKFPSDVHMLSDDLSLWTLSARQKEEAVDHAR